MAHAICWYTPVCTVLASRQADDAKLKEVKLNEVKLNEVGQLSGKAADAEAS